MVIAVFHERIFSVADTTNAGINILTRKVDDKKDRIESSGNTFFENVRKGYLELSKNNERIKLLDAKKQIGDLHQEIVILVEKYL